jgi:hypothetical protein
MCPVIELGTGTTGPQGPEGPAAPMADAVADIADPSTATAEDCANKINELLASMRAAGLLAE